MTQRTLQKWHGAGNDFLVEITSTPNAVAWSISDVRAVCDRHRGVGADGLLLADLDGDDITMTLFNADGSRAEMSGNGIRCLVAAVVRTRGDERREYRVRTDAGYRNVQLELRDGNGHGDVSMGVVTFDEPIDRTLGVARVGNPHAVVLDHEEWSDRDREDLARELSDELAGANVEFATVLDAARVRIVVYERGVGWTLACGTGSVATAALLHQEGLVGERVTVENPGGALEVDLSGTEATLAGPVAFVADVAWTTP